MNKTVDTIAENGKRIYEVPVMEVFLLESDLSLLVDSDVLEENELPVATEEWPEGVSQPW